jgi:hypothetical protein
MGASVRRIATFGIRGISAIDLLIVFAVTSACVVLSAPILSDYSIRARMVDALLAADSAKDAVSIACAVNPSTSELNKARVGFEFPQSKYVQSGDLIGSCVGPVITVVTRNTGASPDPIVLIVGYFEPDLRRYLWTCTSTGTESYLPDTCRD